MRWPGGRLCALHLPHSGSAVRNGSCLSLRSKQASYFRCPVGASFSGSVLTSPPVHRISALLGEIVKACAGFPDLPSEGHAQKSPL